MFLKSLTALERYGRMYTILWSGMSRTISASSWVASDRNVIFIKGVGRCVGALGNETRAVYVLGRFLVLILVGVRMWCRFYFCQFVGVCRCKERLYRLQSVCHHLRRSVRVVFSRCESTVL